MHKLGHAYYETNDEMVRWKAAISHVNGVSSERCNKGKELNL
jgi:hypothetical protein